MSLELASLLQGAGFLHGITETHIGVALLHVLVDGHHLGRPLLASAGGTAAHGLSGTFAMSLAVSLAGTFACLGHLFLLETSKKEPR